MLPLFPSLILAQLLPVQTPTPTPSPETLPPPQEIVQPQGIRPLPGQLDRIPVFNSNSPELLTQGGILLSTFPPEGKANPAAHLNYAFEGRFDVFAHHVAKATTIEEARSLYLGILLYNPGDKPLTVEILQAASYPTQPDAPFNSLPAQVEDAEGIVYAGPGSRVVGDIIRDRHQETFPSKMVIAPGESQLLLNLPILLRNPDLSLNGRSTYLRLRSDGKVYAASLALVAPVDENGQEIQPSLAEWQTLLEQGNLATPRDRTPTPPGSPGVIIYGRVAGVTQGSLWNARLVDRGGFDLTIPQPGEAFSYGISTVDGGTLGTNQVQSAPLLVRYPDTAYKAHGNYGVEYRLALPLYNGSSVPQKVTVSLQTPLKQEKINGGLRFLVPPPSQVFFRGTLQVGYKDEEGNWQTRYFHIVQQRGQQGEPLVTLTIAPKSRQLVQVDFLYPPDATPPQVLTVKTLNNENKEGLNPQ